MIVIPHKAVSQSTNPAGSLRFAAYDEAGS
jgi:hypothetical protein